jgi:hypothetical protein
MQFSDIGVFQHNRLATAVSRIIHERPLCRRRQSYESQKVRVVYRPFCGVRKINDLATLKRKNYVSLHTNMYRQTAVTAASSTDSKPRKQARRDTRSEGLVWVSPTVC